MFKKFSYSLYFIVISFLLSCGDSNYILNNETPSIQEGFFGFRWTTPMSIVDAEFPKRTKATPIDSLNHYNTSNFSDAYFLDQFANLCVFHFNESGLSSVKIIFYTDHRTSESKFYDLMEKLSFIYGKPEIFIGTSTDQNLPEFIGQFKWFKERMNITLNTNYDIEINAYGYYPVEIIHNK